MAEVGEKKMIVKDEEVKELRLELLGGSFTYIMTSLRIKPGETEGRCGMEMQ